MLLVGFVTGCRESSFGNAAPGYDQQGCVERSLRRASAPDLVGSARAAFQKECGEGGPEACSVLGVMNEIGAGGPVNGGLAVELYGRACRDGNVRGCANLGVARVAGIGGAPDVAHGAKLLEWACGRKDAPACFHLGGLYRRGEGVAKDPILAARLFEDACEGDEPAACLVVGQDADGIGQLERGSALYAKACSLGDAEGCARFERPAGSSVLADAR